jgi:hypothetical protein
MTTTQPSQLRLKILDRHDVPGIARELGAQVNGPGWPEVGIMVDNRVVLCNADTWEPLLRVRVEEALEVLLGMRWREAVQWS